ncbi:MAG: DNA-3-methyladenine glycosylase I [Alphaproteobacteria bacterium]|nr:DNA-3-methyladenine glycosylase I [Alphaproteobacteria bacterium]
MTTVPGPDGKPRCRWCAAAPEFFHYHDSEWGLAQGDDFLLFEKLSLEGFQSGLSWRTILAKRPRFREVFHDFDFEKIARFGERDIQRLLKDEGIIRHRGKIEAVINNARRAKDLVKREGSLASFLWRYALPAGSPSSTAATTPESVALSKALKKDGWKFVGPTTVYAFMQAMGLVNDHVEDCVMRAKAEKARKAFKHLKR